MKLTPRYDGPPIIAADGSPDDQLVPVVRQRRRLEALLAGIDDADWNAPSRCDDWTVHDVVAHLVGVNSFWRASILAGLAGTPTRVLVGFDPAATPPLMVEPMRALTPAELLDQLVASDDGFLGALSDLDDAAWSTLAESPAGHIPIRLLAQHGLWDCWIHERDIALPLGMTPTIEPDEVLSSLRYAAALGPAFALTSGTAIGGTFSIEATDPNASFDLDVGDSVMLRTGIAHDGTPTLRGDAVGLVEALSLRTPLPSAAPAEWHRLLAGLATAFDVEPVG